MNWLSRIITASQWGREAAVPSDPGPSTEGMKTMASVSTLLPKSKPQAGTVHWFNDCLTRSQTKSFGEETILTPGLASYILDLNEQNRTRRTNLSDLYSRDIREGRWVYNGEPIIVSKCGRLTDGQHRIVSVIAANTPIRVMFVFGVDFASRLSTDQGGAKTAGDYLSMQNVKNANVAASIAVILKGVENSEGTALRDRYVTKSEVCERVLADAAIGRAAEYTSSVQRFTRELLPPALIGAAYYLFADVDEEDAVEYLNQVCIGENIKRGDPAFAVRQALSNLDAHDRFERLEVVMRGWVRFRKGGKLTLAKSLGKLPAVI